MKNLILILFLCAEAVSICGCYSSIPGKNCQDHVGHGKEEKQQQLLHLAEKAYESGDYQRAIDLTGELCKRNSPCLYDARFLKAAAYMQLGEPEIALDIYGDMHMASLGSHDPVLYFRLNCHIGDAYVAMQKYGKAASAYSLPVTMRDDNDTGHLKPIDKLTPAERRDYMTLVEYASFMAVCCYKKAGKKDEMARILELYKTEFPEGKYQDKWGAIPVPEDGVMKSSY